jgi:hypothetical protein
MTFNYAATLAELYPARSWKRRAGRVTYKRFEVAAEAIRFAIEELPSIFLLGTYLEVEEERFNGQQIRLLYDGNDYPFARKLPFSKTPSDTRNRDQLTAKGLDAGIRYFTKKYGISGAEVRGLVDRFGINEKKLDAAIKRLKKRG